MSENKLPNGPSVESTDGTSAAMISTHKNVSANPASIGTNKSYPESEPCAPIASGSKLSYSGGAKSGISSERG